jgi:hypothetical protein
LADIKFGAAQCLKRGLVSFFVTHLRVKACNLFLIYDIFKGMSSAQFPSKKNSSETVPPAFVEDGSEDIEPESEEMLSNGAECMSSEMEDDDDLSEEGERVGEDEDSHGDGSREEEEEREGEEMEEEESTSQEGIDGDEEEEPEVNRGGSNDDESADDNSEEEPTSRSSKACRVPYSHK